MTETVLTLLGMFILLLLQGFFSGSEIALVNANKLTLRHRAKLGHTGSRMVIKLLERPERLLATTLVGTNISTVTLATLGTVMTIRHIGSGGEALAFLIITPLMLIFGEVVPKSVYQQKADTLAPIIIYPLRFCSWVFFPLILVFSWIAKMAARFVSRGDGKQNVFMAREKIRTLLTSAEQTPGSEIVDRQRIQRAIRFSEISAIEAMIPLNDVVVMNKKESLSDAIEIVSRTGYSRLPVYESNASKIIAVAILST